MAQAGKARVLWIRPSPGGTIHGITISLRVRVMAAFCLSMIPIYTCCSRVINKMSQCGWLLTMHSYVHTHGYTCIPTSIANTNCSSITRLRDLHAHVHLFSEDHPTAKVRFVTCTICTDVFPSCRISAPLSTKHAGSGDNLTPQAPGGLSIKHREMQGGSQDDSSGLAKISDVLFGHVRIHFTSTS